MTAPTLDDMPLRIAIAGWPKAGKTTLAESLTTVRPVQHTDDLIATHDWSAASEAASHWFDAPAFVVEGVAVPRALRKWLARNPEGQPCDVLHWLDKPHVALVPGQVTMGKGCETVLREILPELVRRGVKIEATR